MESQQVYLQAPIKKELREIRILTLAPGIYNDTLHGSFEVESLDYDDIHYTAFSYTWSGPISEKTIQVGGAPLRVTENLAAALRHFRGPVRPKKLWADAICINQSDDKEKGSQVALMGDIYRNASRTWVWLGVESDDSDAAIDSIISFRDFSDFSEKGETQENEESQETQRKEARHPNYPEVHWQAVSHLLERPWWRRIWVVQEVLMSRQSILHCGKREVDLELFVHFATSVGKTFEEAQTLRQKPFFGILDRWYDHKRLVSSCGFSLQPLLQLTCDFQASVRRDKIFALLGMVHREARSWIIPNYAITDRLFLIRLTIYLLQTSLDPLLAINYSRATDCPSWVPDWTNIDRSVLEEVSVEAAQAAEAFSSSLYSGLFGAGRQRQRTEPSIEELTEYQEPTALLVYGWVRDRVKVCIQMPKLANFPDVGSMSARIRKWESCIIECLQNTRFPCTITSAVEQTQYPTASQKRILNHLLYSNAQFHGFQDHATLAFDWYQYLLDKAPTSEKGRTRIENYQEHMQEHQRVGITAREPERYGLKYMRDGGLHPQKHLPDARSCGQLNDVNSLQRTEQMSDRRLKSNVGQFWILTERDDILTCNGNMVAQEGDIVCQPQESLDCFILRKAGETYWTLVGRFQSSPTRDVPRLLVKYLERNSIRKRKGRGSEMQLFKLI